MVKAALVGDGDDLVGDDAVTALETPARLNAFQPVSNLLFELPLAGIESLDRFNQGLGREPRGRRQVRHVDHYEAAWPARDQLRYRVECSKGGL